MWTTRDGYTLQLPHDSLHTILSRLRPEQLRGITGGPLSGDPGPRLAQAVGRVAQAARRTPETIGGALPVFSAPGFRLLVRPRGPTQGEILMVRPESEADAEMIPTDAPGFRRSWTENGKRQNLRVRGARVQITWKEVPLAQARNLSVPDPRKVVYVLAKRTAALEKVYDKKTKTEKTKKAAPERGGTYLRPLYVGETKKQDRMGPRMDVLRAFDVDFAPYVVCVGTIAPVMDPTQQPQQQKKKQKQQQQQQQLNPLVQQVQGPAGPRAFDESSSADWQLLREDVEHVLVRILTKTDYELTVLTPEHPIWIAERGILVTHVNPPAFLDPKGFSRGPQATPYEIAPLGWG